MVHDVGNGGRLSEMAGESLPCLHHTLNEVKWREKIRLLIIIWRESEVLAGDDDVDYPPFNMVISATLSASHEP